MKQLGILCLRIIPLPLILCSFLINNFALPSGWQEMQDRSSHWWRATLVVQAASLEQTIVEAQSNNQHLPLIKTAPSATGDQAIIFVSRQIPPMGTVYWNVPKGMPGVGPFSRFQVAAPGQLLVREANGAIRVLVDGAKPTAASLNLIDVNAPEVSYDGQHIVFAGLVAGDYDRQPMTNPGGWRLYLIQVDGSGLRQLTFSDQDNLNLSQFGDIAGQFRRYDDTDPVWLPDGRIVFSSTRWPSLAMYGAARTSNLFVVNADGSDLHRITAERNGAERPQVDPLTGRIVYSRWWRNFRLAANDMATLTDPAGGFRLKDGLVVANESGYLDDVPGGSANVNRNAWHLASINPDGTDLKLWGIGSSTFLLGEDANFAYGGVFAADGSFYGNFFPMKNGTEAAGFGGIRHYLPGMSGRAIPLLGITSEIGYELVSQNPTSYGVNRGAYASEPALLPDGRLFISWAPDINQDYGLYLFNQIGGEKRLIYFSNLAPGAQISYSSIFPLINPSGEGLIDRQVLTGRIIKYWRSDPAQNPNGQWVQLTFPVPITVRAVRLYNPRQGDEAQSTLQVQATTVILYSDTGATQEVARQRSGPLAISGTDVAFADVKARTVRVVINEVSGKFEDLAVACLAEVEVIARGEAGP